MSAIFRRHLAAEGGAGLVERRLVDVPQADCRAGSQQPLGDRKAKALGAAGDHRGLAVQIDLVHVVFSLSWFAGPI